LYQFVIISARLIVFGIRIGRKASSSTVPRISRGTLVLMGCTTLSVRFFRTSLPIAFCSRETTADTARLFPPTAPEAKTRTQLYCTLRPEFVKLNPCPLSSDAFSRFGGSDNAIHDDEVVSATQRLIQSIIPSFASYLDRRFREEYDSSDSHPNLCS
jgi:hypothetical protein